MKIFLISIFIMALPSLVLSSYKDILLDAQQRLDCPQDICLVEGRDSNFYANAYNNQISINRNLLDQAPFGFRRMVLFHEVVHIKHADFLVGNCLKRSTFFGGLALTYALSGNVVQDPLTQICVTILAGTGASVIVTMQHSKFIERRADTIAANALGCKMCLYEYRDYLEQARVAENQPESSRTFAGYLSGSQVTEIAERFENQKCSHHRAKMN